VQKALMAVDAVGVLTRALPALPLAGGARLFELAQVLVGSERRLGRHFAQQFVAAGGLRPACLDRYTALMTFLLIRTCGRSLGFAYISGLRADASAKIDMP
jgi:hypothetical protein